MEDEDAWLSSYGSKESLWIRLGEIGDFDLLAYIGDGYMGKYALGSKGTVNYEFSEETRSLDEILSVVDNLME